MTNKIIITEKNLFDNDDVLKILKTIKYKGFPEKGEFNISKCEGNHFTIYNRDRELMYRVNEEGKFEVVPYFYNKWVPLYDIVNNILNGIYDAMIKDDASWFANYVLKVDDKITTSQQNLIKDYVCKLKGWHNN